MSPPPSKNIDEIIQQILNREFGEDLSFEPESPGKFGVSNIVRRTLAHLIGWTGKKAVRISCTDGGKLKVSVTDHVYDNFYRVDFGSVTTEVTLDLTKICDLIMVQCIDDPLEFRVSIDNVTYSPYMYVEYGGTCVLPLSARYVRVRETSFGTDGRAYGFV